MRNTAPLVRRLRSHSEMPDSGLDNLPEPPLAAGITGIDGDPAVQWHSDRELQRSDKEYPCFGRLPAAGCVILGSVQTVDRLSHLDLGCLGSLR